ncbi:hypothetical protein GLAREA_11641 [Glarea lozoyensis ATCC 20868]|uniref:Uncharacterized protein n=1 Tax=Glarea lozoyensis (strain ATCC 20868 / MF5171) TaxID=1116229 RepID=S3CGN5_GLAL2|nr:uncharacterized protein GLAREA_11641 [Glarea lozoyensis ATCC 20868]EPE25060.1 hypothetical protein GLAREA_11641 [Glarea lozoyensis ATCC 20868]
MGGSAFALRVPPLNTPRMPSEIYTRVLQHTLALLQSHYEYCAAPIEGPGKTTFGDVDVLVASPVSESYSPFLKNSFILMKPVAEKLKTLLNAEALITTAGNPTVNFAVPWPDDNYQSASDKRYVQVDVHHLPTAERFQWELFHSAHGDLWNILGATIRPFGLTANDVGLYLRIPEIEALDKKKSLIFLTSDPKRVLDFLGLDEDKWWKQFETQGEMFQYATKNRMFWVKEEADDVKEGDVLTNVDLGQEGGDAGKKKLKHNDRQRMAKRPIFRAWIDEFIPMLRKQGGPKEPEITREQIRDEAFYKFGVREVYEKRLKDWQLARHLEELKRDMIKGQIPPVEEIPEGPPFRSAAIRMLIDVIMGGKEFDGTIPPAARKSEEGFYDLDLVQSFITLNWRRAGELGLAHQQVRAMETMRAKEQKKRKAAEEMDRHACAAGPI